MSGTGWKEFPISMISLLPERRQNILATQDALRQQIKWCKSDIAALNNDLLDLDAAERLVAEMLHASPEPSKP